MNKYYIIFLAGTATLTYESVLGQQSAVYTNQYKEYQDAVNLYANKQYQAAQNIFLQVKRKTSNEEIEANCAYYIANCAVRLNQIGADGLMEDFVTNYPTSTKRNSAYKDVADYYFEQGKYPYALKWYEKVEDSNFSNSEQEKLNFNKGYAYFTAKRQDQAKKYFNRVINSKKYGSQAKYYIGYMAYEGDDYSQANEYFDQIQGSDQLNEKLAYYQADMNFKLGKFDLALQQALEQLQKTRDRQEVSELHKIAGESLFNLKRYSEAIPHLEQYKGKKGKWNNTDYYQLGYAYYQEGNYEKAIGQLNKIIDGNNSVAQNAYYHLGQCYLKNDKKQQALNAFKNASQMDFDAQIQEDAMLNYVKLSYEVGNAYESVSALLLSYLSKYPDSGHTEEVRSLLVDSYITSKNYEAALTLLEKNRNYSDKETYQKVAFYRGVELFNEGDYQQAKSYFDKSLSQPINSTYNARARFWKGECDYLLTNYADALISFKQFENSATSSLKENADIDYNIGYTYFKQKNYEKAISYFSKYTESAPKDKSKLNDAYLRLGDSYFVSSNYWPAMETYNKAIALNGVDADYANFQKAISYGFVDRNERKIEELIKFVNTYKKSAYRDDALYELGNVYIAENNVNKGIAAYDQLVNEYKKSSYVPKTLLKEGLIFYNNNQNEKALGKFKTVVRDFPNTQESIQAVSTAKLIYVDEGRVDEYAAWVKNIDFVQVTDAELDNATYESAENQYIQNKTNQAISGFEKYLNQFPNGLHATNAHFYLAQLQFGKGEKAASVPHYEVVISKERNEFTEQALSRLGQIYLENKEYEKAIPVLKRLETEADYPQNISFAQNNLMKAYYEQNDYEATVMYAEKVLSNPKVDDRIASDAHIMIARSAIKTGDEAKAKQAYAEVQKKATGALMAEALYYDVYFKNKEGKYEASNKVMQKLAQEYSGYKEFGAKGLVVMAKNYYAMDDAFNATTILKSVISNFASYPEIVSEAQIELNKIKAEEAKTNASVETDTPVEETQPQQGN
ncbi:TolA-binding protein [Pustulibacterium marinum]|uniref:TolA-binding protein n=1 Tax=Pustulibacterium marinum TaxID=1224947 RepID=A0A1I7FW52_9FLAO|nr:tetratricopeptide repeat protein [Pustulibacterium marinum]SFU40452.1 TolA-binding protein [Pustulibacterium marinum]